MIKFQHFRPYLGYLNFLVWLVSGFKELFNLNQTAVVGSEECQTKLAQAGNSAQMH